MSTLLLAAVGGSRRQAGVAFTADHLFAVVFGGESFERGLDDAASESEDEVEGGFLYDLKELGNRVLPLGFVGKDRRREFTFWIL